MRSKGDHACLGPGTEAVRHRCLISDIREPLGGEILFQVSQTCRNQGRKEVLSPQIGRATWLEQGCEDTWVFCPKGHPRWPKN